MLPLQPTLPGASVFFLGTMGENDYVLWVQPGPCQVGGPEAQPVTGQDLIPAGKRGGTPSCLAQTPRG